MMIVVPKCVPSLQIYMEWRFQILFWPLKPERFKKMSLMLHSRYKCSVKQYSGVAPPLCYFKEKISIILKTKYLRSFKIWAISFIPLTLPTGVPAITSIPPPWPSGYGRGTPWPCLKLRCAGRRECNPRPGQYGKMSFSSWVLVTRWLIRFSHLNMPFLQNSEFI